MLCYDKFYDCIKKALHSSKSHTKGHWISQQNNDAKYKWWITYCVFRLAIVPPEYQVFSLITTNIGSKQQKVHRKRIINFTPHNFGTTQKNERASSKCEKILHDQCKMVGGKTMWSCHESNGRSTYFFNAILHLCPLGIHRTMGSMRK